MKQQNKLDPYKRLIRFLTVMVLVLVLTGMFIFVWKRYHNWGIVFPFYHKGYWLMGAFYAFFYFIFMYLMGGMNVGSLRMSNLCLSHGLAAAAANVCIYLETVLLSARFVSVLPLTCLTCVDMLVILLWVIFSAKLFRRLFPARIVLLLYQEYDPMPFRRKVRMRSDRYIIKESFNVDEEWDMVVKKIDDYDTVFLCDIHAPLRNRLLKYCYAHGIRTYITPKISDIIIRSSENNHMFDTPLLLAKNEGLTFDQRLAKRVLDLVVSIIALVITSPVMLVIAIAIKAYDGGPVFFVQDRCTINGKVFKIHKFRSMIENAEKDGEVIPATDDDARITPVGKIIRKTRLDELPQFFDILIGNMSVVGPRPERVEHVEKYVEEVPEFTYRMKVKGGLTGYAQIYGKYNTSAYDKLKLDLMYIQNYSILLDLRLILMTVKIMFIKDSTEGFEEIKPSEKKD